MDSEERFHVAMDRLLGDCAEFLTRYAWTEHHDESLDLYERIKTAREYVGRLMAPSGQGQTR